jgi:putative transcriptional regulator
MSRSKGNHRVLGELLATGREFGRYGMVSRSDLARLEVLCKTPPVYSPAKVAAIRTKKARASQAVFASLLNVSVSTVQKWESPTAAKRPSGSAAKLLQLIEAKGVEAVLL